MGRNVGLKKGPWTPEEDRKLLAYIEEHGRGSWRALPAVAGLQRSGKSCRLRWTNYHLNPCPFWRGNFSFQEEQTIIQLHARLGNRWASIATHLPDRTDNEIKNYWNTHLKKRLTKTGIDPITHNPTSFTLESPTSTPTISDNIGLGVSPMPRIEFLGTTSGSSETTIKEDEQEWKDLGSSSNLASFTSSLHDMTISMDPGVIEGK